MKKTFLIGTLIISFFLFQSPTPVYPLNQISELLCELGIKLYRSGRYAEALHEFKKALIANPNYTPAKKYVQMIEQANLVEPEIVPSTFKPISPEPKSAMNELLDLVDLQREIISDRELVKVEKEIKKTESKPLIKQKAKKVKKPLITEEQMPEAKNQVKLVEKPAIAKPSKVEVESSRIVQKPDVVVQKSVVSIEQPAKEEIEEIVTPSEEAPSVQEEAAEVVEKKSVVEEGVITLDSSLKSLPSPIQIATGRSFIIKGSNITRYLVDQTDIVKVEKKSPDELLVTGTEIGYTHVYAWDNNGRWSMEFLGVFPQPEGPTYEEIVRKEEERERNFRIKYNLDWSNYQTGRGVGDLKRVTYYWSHNLGIVGPTPYGEVDSSFTVRRLNVKTDLTYFTFGLKDGVLGQFKGFNFRGGDYNPKFTNMAFQGAVLRGVMLNSPAFDKKFNYTVLWGREGGGRYGNLSPNLMKIKNSFLAGTNLQFNPTKKQNYQFTILHGWGRDRDDLLNKYNYDLLGKWNLGKWGMGYEMANDSEKFAHLFNVRFKQEGLSFTTELRNIDKSYNTITGRAWRQGELGALLNLDYKPSDKLTIHSSLDAYQDRLYPAEDNPQRWNQDFNFNATYQLDQVTSVNLDYVLDNDQGKISQIRYQSPSIGVNRIFKLLNKDISTYLNYYHQENANFSAHSSDYVNDKFYAGLRFKLLGALYYYANKEYNMVIEESTGTHTNPNAFETGLDWSDRLGKSPFYASMRFTYRDEENTASRLSFLSGEDYIEGYSQLSYRPNPDVEVYSSFRMRNVWADNPAVNKSFEIDLNAGLRYLWDTGVRWDAVGNIEGYVFKDYNSDGLRQRDEPPVEGIKIWLGKDKYQVTDLFGYYKFKGVRARKAFVSLDTNTLPRGFILTVPLVQEVPILNHRTQIVNFGVTSETEISGFIFEDVDGNGENNREDKGLSGISVTLEDGSKSITDMRGRYSFRNASPGEHTIIVDINTIPVYYLPQKALKKQITLFEGVNYVYDLPLKKIEE